MQGHILVDFDGTLATYDRWEGSDVLGEPIPDMVHRVRRWLEDGRDVRIFTARAYDPKERKIAIPAIEAWCLKHLGRKLPITTTKDMHTIEIWDDRAVQVIHNTGLYVGDSRVEGTVVSPRLGFEEELQNLINRYSQENGSNTPDFILAQYLAGCLSAFNQAVQQRETWYGRDARPGEILPQEVS